MTDVEAINFTKDIFDLIKKAKTIEDLECIPDKMEIPIKNRMNIDGYPKIEFSISATEIKLLQDSKILDDNYKFASDITSKLTDPLAKILYATVWKNGDLKKVRHIIKGVLDSDVENSEQDDALVFYQFGKYLTKLQGQPIIDQHVIRAFAVYKLLDSDQISSLRKIELINKRHKPIINLYKEWLTSRELTNELKNFKDYTYHIDKLLFATGKSIKERS
ncbi:MAG: hypothetical protein EAY66_05895 [Sphingobacteriales bacterium]|nr:MAG: hypothetical protein EAY66_05895 [Sphingobacteriales bacterium]